MATETKVHTIDVDGWHYVEETIARAVNDHERDGWVLYQIAGPTFDRGVKAILVFRRGAS